MAYRNIPLSLTEFVTSGTGVKLGAAAGTPSGAMGVTAGTFGSANPTVVGEAANNNSKTNSMRFLYVLPQHYCAGAAIVVRIRAKVGAAMAASQTIDCEAYLGTRGAALGSDLCATAAQTLTTSYADYDFTITPTGLVPGDLLDIKITGVADDTGGTANEKIYVADVAVRLNRTPT